MQNPYPLIGIVCLIFGVLLAIGGPVQRGRLNHRFWDVVIVGLFVLGVCLVRYWDDPSNFVVGLAAGLVAILIRDIRSWVGRFQGQVYRRSHRYYWYGRARDWYGRRRRRY
jgi:hypothetical protein